MFKDDTQIGRVNRVLTESVMMMNGYWDEEGPTKKAVDFIDGLGGGISSSEVAMLNFTFYLWNSYNNRECFDFVVFDYEKVRAIGELLIAYTEGGNAIEDWIQKWESNEAQIAHHAMTGE